MVGDIQRNYYGYYPVSVRKEQEKNSVMFNVLNMIIQTSKLPQLSIINNNMLIPHS